MAEHTWKYIEDNAAFLENISLERVVLDVLKILFIFFQILLLLESCVQSCLNVCVLQLQMD